MATVRAKTWEDKEYDNCGRDTIAVIEVGNVSIQLCKKCYSELRGSLKEFDETTFCHECKYFDMSSAGWNYGGFCRKRERDVSCMDTCPEASASGKKG